MFISLLHFLCKIMIKRKKEKKGSINIPNHLFFSLADWLTGFLLTSSIIMEYRWMAYCTSLWKFKFKSRRKNNKYFYVHVQPYFGVHHNHLWWGQEEHDGVWLLLYFYTHTTQEGSEMGTRANIMFMFMF